MSFLNFAVSLKLLIFYCCRFPVWCRFWFLFIIMTSLFIYDIVFHYRVLIFLFFNPIRCRYDVVIWTFCRFPLCRRFSILWPFVFLLCNIFHHLTVSKIGKIHTVITYYKSPKQPKYFTTSYLKSHHQFLISPDRIDLVRFQIT